MTSHLKKYQKWSGKLVSRHKAPEWVHRGLAAAAAAAEALSSGAARRAKQMIDPRSGYSTDDVTATLREARVGKEEGDGERVGESQAALRAGGFTSRCTLLNSPDTTALGR